MQCVDAGSTVRATVAAWGRGLRRPWSENRSGARGTTTKSAAMSTALLIAPRLGPTSTRTRSASASLSACRSVLLSAVMTRKARSLLSRHRGHWLERSSSALDSSRSPGTRASPGAGFCIAVAAMSRGCLAAVATRAPWIVSRGGSGVSSSSIPYSSRNMLVRLACGSRSAATTVTPRSAYIQAK